MDFKRIFYHSEDGTMMKQTTALLRAFIAGGALFAGQAGTVLAATVTVCPSGCNQSTITAGLNVANAGDTVLVGTPGRTVAEIYNENILMKDNVNLVSEGDNTTTTYTDPLGATGYTTTVLKRAALTVIHGAGTSGVVTFSFTMTTNTVLDGFTIEHVSATAVDWTGLVLVGGTSPTIRNNIIRDNQGPAHNGGITMVGGGTTSSPLIENNVIHYMNGPGVGVRSNANPTIIGNEIFTTPPLLPDYAPGIGLADAASATILNNKLFRNGRAGVGSVEFGVADTGIPIVIKGNTIYDNSYGTGANLNAAGVRITGQTGSTNVQVEVGGPNPTDSNEFWGNKAGVYLDHKDVPSGRIAYAIIENNNFHNNLIAVRAENMALVTIKDNTMDDQSMYCAVRVGNSDSAVIQGNSMYNNIRCGIRFWDGDFAPALDIQNNDIANNGYGGVALDDAGMHGIVANNHIHQNGFGGMVITGEAILEISNNEIDHNVRGGLHTGGLSPDGQGFTGAPGSAVLTIRGNKIHHNGQVDIGGGIDVRHASGTIENNLVYKNNMGGIRYGDWINAINNNTVVYNGQSGQGAGIAFDDLLGAVNQNPPQGSPTNPIPIENNILVGNANAGVNAGTLYSGGATCPVHVGFRQYNLYSANNGQAASCPPFGPWCKRPQLGMCNENTGEIFVAPQFVDASNDDYRLLGTSPAVDSGDPTFPDDVSIPPGVGLLDVDMGAYGGQYGINW